MNRLQTAREIFDSLPVHANARERPRFGAVAAALEEVRIDGDFAQFGVFRGATARQIEASTTADRTLHLFDSFEGLPEDWTKRKKAGAFALTPDKIPVFASPRVVMHKGWFKDTVPDWARRMDRPLAFVHMDADLYSSTIEVLFPANRLIVKNSIVLFDEYILGRADDEHRALLDWAAKFQRSFDYLWRSSTHQVCIRVSDGDYLPP